MAGKGQAEGCAACLKWLLIIFNILFCLLGIGFIAAGVYAFVQLGEYLNLIGEPNVNIPGILLIVFGCITFIVAALGCIGACKESPCLLFTFAVIIGVLLVAEIIVGAVAFGYREKIEAKIEEYGPEALKNNATGARDFWDLIQKKFDCCGVNGPEDYDGEVPDSCKTKPEGSDVHQEGCKEAAIEFIKNNIYAVGGVAIGFAIIELLGIVFACCVGCAARKGEYA